MAIRRAAESLRHEWHISQRLKVPRLLYTNCNGNSGRSGCGTRCADCKPWPESPVRRQIVSLHPVTPAYGSRQTGVITPFSRQVPFLKISNAVYCPSHAKETSHKLQNYPFVSQREAFCVSSIFFSSPLVCSSFSSVTFPSSVPPFSFSACHTHFPFCKEAKTGSVSKLQFQSCALKMESACLSETLVTTYQTTRRYF
jgi:hypothetical protein